MRTWTNEDLVQAVSNSTSYRETISRLGLIPAGNNYQYIKSEIAKLNLTTNHFLGRGHLRGKTHNWAKKKALDEILVKDKYINDLSKVKLRLVKEGLLSYACFGCGIFEWSSAGLVKSGKLSLHLDHINGDRLDNRLENLRLLCPNCHSLTDTYCGKNKGKANPGVKQQLIISSLTQSKIKSQCISLCPKCSSKKSPKSSFCRPCLNASRLESASNNLNTKIQWPPDIELLEKLSQSNFSKLAKELGVSDNAIRKRLRKRSLLN